MAERLTFTLAGRDELSRVLDGSADSADRLRLRLAGITADADGNLRDLQGRFLSVADAQRRLAGTTDGTRHSFGSLSDSADKVGEALRANLISLAPAAIPAAAGLAGAAGALAVQFGAVALSAAAYGLALKGQLTGLSEAVDAEGKYEEAVRTSGATSQEAVKAQVAYQQSLAKLPPETQRAAVAVGLLKENFQDWSDSLAGDVMGPFNKGVAVANRLLPETTGLVKGASTQFDRLITMLGGAISTPGFDALTGKVTDFADRTLDHAVDELTVFFAKLEAGQFDDSGLRRFLDYARANGPAVFDTLENVGDALLHVLEAGSDVGVGMLQVINALSGIVSAVPPEAIATMLQLAIAIKAVKLAAVGTDAARVAVAALGLQITRMRTAAAGAPGALTRTTAAIGALSRGAKLAVAGTGIGLLLIALTSLADRGRGAAPDVDQLATSLRHLADSGKFTGELKKTFGDMDGLIDKVKLLKQETKDMKEGAFGFRIPVLDDIADWAAGPLSDITKGEKSLNALKDDFDSLDKSLASLVQSGYGDAAAKDFATISAAMKEAGYSTETINGLFGEYREALAGQALEQRLAAESLGLFGQQAMQVRAELELQKQSTDGLRQSIIALNDVHRQGLTGMIGFEAAIDAASKAAQENAGVLDMQGGKLVLNTDKQRAAAQALNELAAKTDEAAGAARESGATWGEVNGIYERGRQQLIKNAVQMGLTRSEAEKLADQILKTPDKTARLKGDLEDLKAKLAEAKARLAKAPSSKTAAIRADISDLQRKIAIAKDALSNLDGYSATTWIYTNYSTPHHMATGGLVHRASGGPIPGFPGGGRVSGPGTSTSDSVPAMLSNGEYVINAAATSKYLPLIEAINAGALGGRSAIRPGLPAASASAAGSGSGGWDVHVNFRDDRLRDLIEVTVTPKIRESEQRQAFRYKVGRR